MDSREAEDRSLRSEPSAIARRNHAGSERPKAVLVGCRLCPEHGDSVPHHLLDNDAYPVSICRCAFRLLGRHVGGSRHRLRLQGNPSREPVCWYRAPNSHVRELRAVFALPLALPAFTPVGMAALIALGTLVMALLGRREDIVTVGITTAVVMVVAAMSPVDAWQQPLLRLADTMVGIAVGVACKWVGSFLFYQLFGEQAQ